MTDLNEKEQEKAVEIAREFLYAMNALTIEKLSQVSEKVLKQAIYNFIVKIVASAVYTSNAPIIPFFDDLMDDVKKLVSPIKLHKKNKEKND